MHVMDGKTVKPSKYVPISWLRHCHIPGSSRYVKSLPFGAFFVGEFRHKRYTQKEDPGMSIVIVLSYPKDPYDWKVYLPTCG